MDGVGCIRLTALRSAALIVHRGDGMAEKQETLVVKQNRHVVIALNHLKKRHEALLAQSDKIAAQIAELDAAIKALE